MGIACLVTLIAKLWPLHHGIRSNNERIPATEELKFSMARDFICIAADQSVRGILDPRGRTVRSAHVEKVPQRRQRRII